MITLPVAACFVPDRFQRREVERLLTAELHAAQEQVRLLAAQLRELTQINDGGPNPNDSESASEVRARHLEAKRANDRALQRYRDFVIRGIVPKDLGI